MLRIFFTLFALSLSLPAVAVERYMSAGKLLNDQPILNPRAPKAIRLEKKSGRMPASVEATRAEDSALREDLEKKLKVGTYAIVRNSVEEWNNEVVQVISRYEDGARKILLGNGQRARVAYENLSTLSPETDKCCDSHGVKVCKGDKVYHPLPSTSIGIPEGKVRRVFESCALIVRDGLDFVYDSQQVGKAVDCSPQKESVCVGKIVYIQGYRNGNRFDFEGPVAQVFTNGTILVRTGLWLLPVDATTVQVQTDTLDAIPEFSNNGAMISSRDGQRKIYTPTYPEIEPFDANDSQQLFNKQGLSVPKR